MVLVAREIRWVDEKDKKLGGVNVNFLFLVFSHILWRGNERHNQKEVTH